MSVRTTRAEARVATNLVDETRAAAWGNDLFEFLDFAEFIDVERFFLNGHAFASFGGGFNHTKPSITRKNLFALLSRDGPGFGTFVRDIEVTGEPFRGVK